MEKIAGIFSAIRAHKTVFSFLFIIAILLYAQSISLSQKYVKEDKAEQEISSPTATSIPTPTNVPASILAPKPTNTPTPSEIFGNKGAISLTTFFYPGAMQISLSEEKLILESSDDSDKITGWYKSKIESLGMSTKSFVTTKTNGNVLNKLVGDDGNMEIRVEIQKKNDETQTKITIAIESS